MMMQQQLANLLRLGLMLVCSLSIALFSAAAGASALEQLQQFMATTQSARGTFIQYGSDMKPASGDFVFKRPGQFIWTYRQPYEQLLQADGKHLFIYDKDLNQVTIKKLDDALTTAPAAILFGSTHWQPYFDLKEVGSKDGLSWLKATPKNQDTTFESISIGFSHNMPAAMELRDNFGRVSLLKLTQLAQNPQLTAQSFVFTVPEGVDVLEQE